ncbi:hypothetical protein AB0L62_17530 [Nocardia asteroides]|uniref:hypothetical protein n=1 Tax=Nocardia asteroides TaxID=1824 RepID=UPI003439FA78
MVTSSHEAMHRIFQHDAAAIAHAFTVLKLPFSKPTAVEQVSVDLTETAPVERRADTVLDITTVDDRFLMVVEAQSAPDDSRPDAWSYYVSFLRNKYGLPVILVVICHDHVTARWASAPMRLGHAFWTTITLRPRDTEGDRRGPPSDGWERDDRVLCRVDRAGNFAYGSR